MLSAFIKRFTQLFRPDHCQQLAKEHGWQKRRGKIPAFEFLYSSVFGQSSALALTLNAQATSLSQTVSRQAVDQRYTAAAVAFFKAAFEQGLQQTLAYRLDSPMSLLLQKGFAAIRLFDSTSCGCAPALSTLFPACGGGGEAGLKILLSCEYGCSQLQPLAVLPGKRSDQGLAGLVAQHVGANELGIFDKGFYKAESLRGLHQRGGYFLLPWPRSVSVWETTTGARQLLDVAAELRATIGESREWSQVELGQQADTRLGPVRLLAYRLSPESAARHRADVREKCRTHGRLPTAQALELAGWLVLLTNAPAQRLPLAAAAYLYRVRWQVELIFKQWKSVLRIQVLPGTNENRVQCEVWARLLAAVLGFVWHQHAGAACQTLHRREISFLKLAKQLQQYGQVLIRTLFSERADWETLLRDLWNKVLKLARKEHQKSRQTTWENLCTHWLNLLPTTGSN
jgi:hypothetical protein